MKIVIRPAPAVLLIAATLCRAEALTEPEADARLRLAHQLAREKNDRALVERAAQARESARAAFEAKNPGAADKAIREIEQAVGIDPGGWSMGGLKIFRPTAEYLARRDELGRALEAAMAKGDANAVRAAVAATRKALGDQAGLPDARRPGQRAKPHPVSEAEAVDLFLKALRSEGRAMEDIAAGRTVGQNMLRRYADVVVGCCEIRPAVGKHQAAKLAEVDRLIAGACSILTRLQRPEGHFPFPDLRGRHLRFGEMTGKFAAAQPDAVKDGWLIAPDPGGGSQFDTGVCGVALLQAGAVLGRGEWTQAGGRAADWALAQRCVPNFNYNAFSVGLLAQAYRVTGDGRHLDGALTKLRVGVAPGQVENGRWMDPHNARTVYHLILLRALHDLLESLPAAADALRDEVLPLAASAVHALLDEFEAAGVTVVGLRELLRHETLNPRPDKRLRPMIEVTASVVRGKCVRGERGRMGVAVADLAALHRAWRK